MGDDHPEFQDFSGTLQVPSVWKVRPLKMPGARHTRSSRPNTRITAKRQESMPNSPGIGSFQWATLQIKRGT